MFGSAPFGNNMFGSTSFGTFGSAPAQPAAPVGTTIRFVPLAGTDSVQKTGTGNTNQQSQVSTRHQNICAMKEYETKSADELRLEDYTAGRKVGQPQANPLGSSPFGASMFGVNKPNTTTASSPFNVGSPFGANTSATNNQSSFSMFSKPAEPQPASLFGTQPSTSTQASGFSIFGNQPNQTQAQSPSIFGQTNTPNLFNSTINKPATTTATSPFAPATPFGGTSTATLNKPALGTSLFGTNQNTVSQPSSIFGATSNVNTSAPFGVSAPATSNQSNFSIFNKPPENQPAPLFGTQTSTSSPFGTSIFGQNKPATTPANSTFNFGPTFTPNTSTTNNQSTFSMFSKPAEPQPASLFGTQPSTSNQSSSFSIFGNQPNQTQTQTPSIFGQTNTPNLFNSTLNKPAATTGSSPFAPTTPFGGTNTATLNKPTLGTSLFGTTQNPVSQPNSLFGVTSNVNTSTPFGGNTSTISNQSNFSIFNKPPENQPAPLFGTQPSTNTSFNTSTFDINKPTATTTSPNIGSPLGISLWQQTILSSPPTRISNPYKMNAKTSLKLNKPAAPITNFVLFDEIDERDNDDLRCAIDVFVPKKTIKKLDLTSGPQESFSPSDSSLDGSLKSCVICTRPEYKLKPNLEEIDRRYNSENDTCIVDSLLIERPNYGSIYYDSPMDVKGLNIDEVVHIRRKEVIVYPDDENKPPVGQGLNRPATVTLHQVWPIDKATKEVIKDVNRLQLMRYHEKIEAATIQEGAKFLEYRPETGSWIFAVDHFSKYSMVDDYADESPNEPPTTRSVPPSTPKLVAPTIITPLPKSVTPTLVSHPKAVTPTSVPSSRGATPSLASSSKLLSTNGLSATKLMTYDTTPPRMMIHDTTSSKMMTPNVLFDDLDHDGVHVSYVSRNSTKRLPLSDATPNICDILLTPRKKVNSLKLKPDLYAAKNKLIRDINSVCVSGAPKVRFFNGSRKLCYVNNDNVLVSELQMIPGSEKMDEIFNTLLCENSTVISFDTQNLFAPYIETKDYITSASSYELLRALYGVDLKSKTPYARQDEKLSRVINWLASVNQKLSPPPPEDLYAHIIYLMSCDQYNQAATMALELDHPRLALLVSTLNLNKDLIYEQLCSWRASTADQYIDPSLLKIYILLAGLTEWRLSNELLVKCLDGLKWTQQLCLLATHVTSFATEQDKYGFQLLPLWMKRLETDTNDVDYHIMANHSPRNILSAAQSLIEEWFLLESLKSFHVINSEADCAESDIIHCNLASQLASTDLRWACFVALHIGHNEVRKQVLVQCLEQNQSQLDSNQRWLENCLKIPREFIEGAKCKVRQI